MSDSDELKRCYSELDDLRERLAASRKDAAAEQGRADRLEEELRGFRSSLATACGKLALADLRAEKAAAELKACKEHLSSEQSADGKRISEAREAMLSAEAARDRLAAELAETKRLHDESAAQKLAVFHDDRANKCMEASRLLTAENARLRVLLEAKARGLSSSTERRLPSSGR